MLSSDPTFANSFSASEIAASEKSIREELRSCQQGVFAQALTAKSNDRRRIASVLGSLGNVDIATRLAETAHRYVYEGLGAAKRVGDSAVDAQISGTLGNLLLINNWL